MNQNQFHDQLFDREINRKITRLNIHKTWNNKFHVGIKEGKIHLLTDLEQGQTNHGIDLIIDKKNWDLSLWTISKLMERFDLEPNNISVRKECKINKERLLEEINDEIDIPFEDELENYDDLSNIEEVIEDSNLGYLDEKY